MNILILLSLSLFSAHASQQVFSNQQATIRNGNDLCPQEHTFLTQRLPFVKNKLEQLLGSTIADNQVPVIALCCSGGSYRAMITVLGALQGLSFDEQVPPSPAKNLTSTAVHYALMVWNFLHPQPALDMPITIPSLDLLDICTYAAATSGSCWALTSLMQSRLSPAELLRKLQQAITVNLLEKPDIDAIIKQLLTKYADEQPLSLIDVFGCLLSQRLLSACGTRPYDMTLVDQQAYVATGQVPLPLYTAIIGSLTTCPWIEFSPFEIGGPFLNSYVPTWAFGRSFNHGQSQDICTPQSLGFCMGIWGSAISLNIKEFFNIMIKPELNSLLATYFSSQQRTRMMNPLLNALEKIYRLGNHNFLLDERVSPAQVYNWNYGTKNPLGTVEYLTLVDAGLNLNVPLPPLLNRPRNVDIIIMLDATIDSNPGDELHKARDYAHNHGMPFPDINYVHLHKNCSVHTSKDGSAPVIIYLPLIANPTYQNGWDPRTAPFTGTFQLAYTQEQTALLAGLAQYTMAQNKELLVDAIQDRIAMKKRQTY